MSHTIARYLMESSICLLLFYGFYHLLLRRETFFQLNRIYLLFTPLLALLIPWLQIDLHPTAAPQPMDILYPVITNVSEVRTVFWEQMALPTPAFAFTLFDLVLLVYLLGALYMTIRLGYGLWRLRKLILRSHHQKTAAYTMVNSENRVPAASFFSYIFWNQNALTPQQQLILEHELVHVRQRHSIDVLVMEGWIILKWFNPLIYLFRYHLQLTHEYIADRYVTQQQATAIDYAQLLTQTETSKTDRLLNTFHSQLKMRLTMLANPNSNRWHYLRYFLILPLTAVLTMLFSFDMTERLPSEITQPMAETGAYLDALGNKSIFTLEENRPGYQLQWGDLLCDCKNEQFPNFYRCANQSMTIKEFKRLKRAKEGFQLLKDGQEISVRDLEVMSKRMVDMGGYLGQFDKMENFNADSPLWDKPQKGDVYKFTFDADDNQHFELQVLLTPRSVKEDQTYEVELDRWSFSIDMTTGLGNRHFDFADFQNAMQHPLRISAHEGEWLTIKEATITNSQAFRKHTLKAASMQAIHLNDLAAAKDAMPGDAINLQLVTDQGEQLKLRLNIRENSSWLGERRKVSLAWGEESVDMPPFYFFFNAEQIRNLPKDPLYLVINGQRHQLASIGRGFNGAGTVAARGMVDVPSGTDAVDGIRSIIRKTEAGYTFRMVDLKFTGDYYLPGLSGWHTYLLNWTKLFPQAKELQVTENGQKAILSNPTPAEWETIQSLAFMQGQQPQYVLNGEPFWENLKDPGSIKKLDASQLKKVVLLDPQTAINKYGMQSRALFGVVEITTE